jgi:hypothetical protein
VPFSCLLFTTVMGRDESESNKFVCDEEGKRRRKFAVLREMKNAPDDAQLLKLLRSTRGLDSGEARRTSRVSRSTPNKRHLMM